MPRREDPLNYDAKLTVGVTTWVTDPFSKRMNAAAKALGWTSSQLLRWAMTQTIGHAEQVALQRASALTSAKRSKNGHAKNGNGSA